jgi:hypothetical protein
MKNIFILMLLVLSACASVKKVKNSIIPDNGIVTPTKLKEQNEFVKIGQEKQNPEKQIATPENFTKWTLFTGTGSFILFQYLKWRNIV